MDEFFVYDNVSNRVEINDCSLLRIKEFADLRRNDKSKTGDLFLRELTYIYLAISWKSPYKDYSEQERHEAALSDASLTEEEFNNPIFRAACRKYREIQESNKSIKLLNAAKEMVDKFIDYFQTADPLERDEQTGKPIYKVKDIQAELKNLIDVHETMVTLEAQVKKQLEAQSTLRGGVQEDFDPGEF